MRFSPYFFCSLRNKYFSLGKNTLELTIDVHIHHFSSYKNTFGALFFTFDQRIESVWTTLRRVTRVKWTPLAERTLNKIRGYDFLYGQRSKDAFKLPPASVRTTYAFLFFFHPLCFVPLVPRWSHKPPDAIVGKISCKNKKSGHGKIAHFPDYEIKRLTSKSAYLRNRSFQRQVTLIYGSRPWHLNITCVYFPVNIIYVCERSRLAFRSLWNARRDPH